MKLHIENSIVIEMNGKTATLGCGEYEFDSVSEFIKFIESLGYELKQPLIKDEKIRKAVRAWADANSLKWAAYSADGKFYSKTTDTEISFKTYTNRLDIPECKPLPISELCGEEEE